MKKLTTTMMTCGILASCLLTASAAPTLRVSGDGGTTWTVVEDNGPLDQNSAAGAIFYSGPVGDWALSISSGQGTPFIGNPTAPDMDLSTINVSSKPATLIAQFCETNLSTFATETYVLNTAIITGGSVNSTAYRDSGNVLFGTTASYVGDPAGISPSPTASLLLTTGTVNGNNTVSNGVAYAAVGSAPNSLTLETVITHTGAGSTQVDAHLFALPQPPCNCTVTFVAPNFSVCAGDPIPDATASEDCGNGPTSVPVIVTGTATNGICPQIITRTNTAVDDCGNTSTAVQTITVNCKPDCTLKASVTTAVAGTGGLKAFVADAGPGANYLWTIVNGSITNGQGTTNITFVAGTDASQPVMICVTVSTAAGCMTKCCLNIPLTPRCDCTVTFCSPRSITNCAGDTIPAVVAYQKCSNGASNAVTVSVIGSKTNGSCPYIITRTNAAMSACGDVYTFVQTITVNCRGTICGHIFADCDGDGDLTKGDVGLSKVIVSLMLSNKVIVSLMTDTNGGYCFTNLAGGCYVVAVTPPTNYCQTAASTSYHWRDSYGRDCWNENDGNIHCVSSGTECWWDNYNTCHWKDSYNRDCWKDNWGGYHCQPCSYQSCNAQTNNNKISVCISNCASQGDVDFAYTGTKPSLSVCVKGPSYVKCGQTYTYTCTVTNTGNVCFTGGTVCHTIGNCNNWGGWNNCNNYNTTCPPLSPGQHCTITKTCTFYSWNCGTVACQSTVNCYKNNNNGSCSGQSVCYSSCGW